MMAIQTEIQLLQANMIAALAVLVAFPQVDPIKPVVDLFSPEDTLLTYFGKRPHTNDPDIVRLQVGLTEEQRHEVARIRLIQENKIW